MPGLERFHGEKIGVLGLGASGLAAALALKSAGAEVVAFDDDPSALVQGPAASLSPGTERDVASLSLLVVSPGVPLTHPRPHPLAARAREAGVRLTCDVELFSEPLAEAGRTLVAVTGTNGKSTTAALIHHLLVACGRSAILGGNIGKPVFELDPGGEDCTVVLEVSSYQLDLCTRFHPSIAVWLNLTPDHLDRHGDLDGYVRAKRRIFDRLGPGDQAVIGVDDEVSREVAQSVVRTRGCRVVQVATLEGIDADYVVDGVWLKTCHGTIERPICRLDDLPTIKGAHNRQNAAVALAVAACLGLQESEAAPALSSFEGLPHRMEEVAKRGRVRFVNDSKATNPEAASRSLATFAHIYWIAGGRPKPGGFEILLPHLTQVRRAYLIGEAERDLAQALEGKVAVRRCASLERATEAAYEDASASGDEAVVLLAPACASFDQFRNFAARGDAFRSLARALTGSQDGTGG